MVRRFRNIELGWRLGWLKIKFQRNRRIRWVADWVGYWTKVWKYVACHTRCMYPCLDCSQALLCSATWQNSKNCNQNDVLSAAFEYCIYVINNVVHNSFCRASQEQSLYVFPFWSRHSFVFIQSYIILLRALTFVIWLVLLVSILARPGSNNCEHVFQESTMTSKK